MRGRAGRGSGGPAERAAAADADRPVLTDAFPVSDVIGSLRLESDQCLCTCVISLVPRVLIPPQAESCVGLVSNVRM